MSVAALVLAGGQGRRFGGADKAFLPLAGRPLIEHVLARLRPQAGPIALSANGDPSRFAAYALPVLPDPAEFAACGPLAGVLAGLLWAQAQGACWLLTIPVDTPCFPPDLAARLAPGPAVAVHGGRQHHLAALWPAAFAAGLAGFLRQDRLWRVRDALSLCGARQVGFAGAQDPFRNLNRPEDLAALAAGDTKS